jgi:hypothetical protein
MKAIVTCLLQKQVYEAWEGGVMWYNLDGCLICYALCAYYKPTFTKV